jgi:hypothetical protein
MIVFSAEAHMPPPAAGSPHADVDAELRYSILLVVYPDIYNNLHKVYAGVTDKFHLDLTPRLELIDAVDADGDGRGELLFREISDAGTGWVIYRPTADKLWRVRFPDLWRCYSRRIPQFRMSVGTGMLVWREIPSASLRAGSSLRLKNGSGQDDASSGAGGLGCCTYIAAAMQSLKEIQSSCV